jgi:hypothetical protein
MRPLGMDSSLAFSRQPTGIERVSGRPVRSTDLLDWDLARPPTASRPPPGRLSAEVSTSHLLGSIFLDIIKSPSPVLQQPLERDI